MPLVSRHARTQALARVSVLKARLPNTKRGPSRIAAKHQGAFARSYEKLVSIRFTEAEKSRLLAALARGDAAEVAASMPVFDPTEKLKRDLEQAYGQVVLAAGKAESARLEQVVARKADARFSFDLDNPYSEPWIRSQAGNLIKDVTEEQIEAVRDAVARGFELGLPPREMARVIEESVGLDARYSTAVMNRLGLHLSQGMDPERAGSMAERYARTLLRDRAERIARTETIEAEAQGLLHSWWDARDEGVLPAGAKKTWIEAAGSSRTCLICEELGSLDPIEIDDEWDSQELGAKVGAPPSHPNCRCSIGLVLP